MFKKIVAIDSTGMDEEHIGLLHELCGEYVGYATCPKTPQEAIQRIGDADALLVSFATQITAEIIMACPNLRYIGMCCSLYSEESANVDIACCREHGITVRGIRGFSDEGVAEYCIGALIQLLHGFGPHIWKSKPMELNGVKVGIVGLGATGTLFANALQHFRAEVRYFSRTRKPLEEEKGIAYMPLDELVQWADIISTHVNKNTILLHEKQFELMGSGKILMNTAIGPTFDVEAIKRWLSADLGNYYLCDPASIMGTEELLELPNVLYTPHSHGFSVQCSQRLSEKVIENIRSFLGCQA